jgi:hypothetical protein
MINKQNGMAENSPDVLLARKFLGFSGPSEQLENFLASNPAAAARMGKYQQAMSGMAKKGFAIGGSASEAPNYQDFLNSDFYKNTQGQISPQVMDPVTVGDQTYNFSSPLQGMAYRDYMKSIGQETTSNPNNSAIVDLNQQPGVGYGTLTDGVKTVLPSQQNFNYTYEQAVGRQSQRDVKTPEEQAAINAALAMGPSTQQQNWQSGGQTLEDFQKQQQELIANTMQPTASNVAQIAPTPGQDIAAGTGQVTPTAPTVTAETVGQAQAAATPTATPAATMTATTAAPAVQTETAATQAQVGTVSQDAQVQAQQQTTTSIDGMQAAQGMATMVNAPAARQIQQGELISGVADAQVASTFNEQIQAATATPTTQATVQGQLDGLMQQFQGRQPPAWAAGAMRAATAQMAARGLGASSMAGQALVQAAMESALPIAQADANIVAQFEAQNLSNRQQRAMLAAQQRAQFMGMEFDQAFQARVANSARIGDIANMNFTAEQQIALENSRAVNTMNLNNLSNRQAMVMAEAAALSNLDMANLNNRQQSAVQNAQNFMQMDMANLSNAQQTELFKAQQNIQALFTDQAAENAAAQFNASSENQTNQFFANLGSQVSQFNAAQSNAMAQYDASSINSIRQFNAQMQQQRDQFNAQNGLVVAQANAQWRQNIATLNTAAQNEANMDYAKTINALTSKNLDEIWQRERDIMSFAFTADQSAMDRSLQIILGDKELEFARQKLAQAEDAAKTNLAMRFLFGTSPEGILGGIFKNGLFGLGG